MAFSQLTMQAISWVWAKNIFSRWGITLYFLQTIRICQTLWISSSSLGFDGGGCSSVFFASESELAAAWTLDLDGLVDPPSVDLLDFFLRVWFGASMEDSLVDESNPELGFWLRRLGCLGMSDASPVEALEELLWWRLNALGASDCSLFVEFWVWWRLDNFGCSGSPLELRRPESGKVWVVKWHYKLQLTF